MLAVICKTYKEFKNAVAGAVEIRGRGVHAETDQPLYGGAAIKCPGCGLDSYLPFDGSGSNNWRFDGNTEQPSVVPSVFHTKELGGCGWHGYLTNGEWVSC